MITCKDIKPGDIVIWESDKNNYLSNGTRLRVIRLTKQGAIFHCLEICTDKYGNSYDTNYNMNFMETAGMNHLKLDKSYVEKSSNRFNLIFEDT